MRVALVACYELGHQPLHVASPAAKLRTRGHEVRCLDLALDSWDPQLVDWAERIAFSVPMHTAARIARRAIDVVREQRPELPVAAYGLYGGMLDEVADCAIAGETDAALVDWVGGHRGDQGVLLGRESAAPGAPLPARDLLPPLSRYARLQIGAEERTAGYVEASHGCAHRCRHCPVPVVYDGRIRIVEHDAVIADVAQQVAAGARHITFGDPDFLNGVHHSLRVVREVHERFPQVTFDCTVKVEHILRHDEIWEEMAASGCLFVVSAFESVDEATLLRLDKGHTTADASRAIGLLREHGIEIRPSWMPFTPWTTLEQLQALLDFVADHDLTANVDPVQYTIRLLIPEGSLLLGHPDLEPHLAGYDEQRATYDWHSADPAMDALQQRVANVVEQRTASGDDAATITNAVRALCGRAPIATPAGSSTARPRLSESWFCCAEPTELQLHPLDQSAM